MLFPFLHYNGNGRDGVSNHQPHDCLLSRLFRHRSKKTSKLRVTGLYARNSLMTGEFRAQKPVTWKMFPFDDVIVVCSDWSFIGYLRELTLTPVLCVHIVDYICHIVWPFTHIVMVTLWSKISESVGNWKEDYWRKIFCEICSSWVLGAEKPCTAPESQYIFMVHLVVC